MTRQLTLTLDEAVAERAEALARARGTDVSGLFAGFFEVRPTDEVADDPEMAAILRRNPGLAALREHFRGSGGIEEYHRWLDQRYGSR